MKSTLPKYQKEQKYAEIVCSADIRTSCIFTLGFSIYLTVYWLEKDPFSEFLIFSVVEIADVHWLFLSSFPFYSPLFLLFLFYFFILLVSSFSLRELERERIKSLGKSCVAVKAFQLICSV